MHLFQPPWYEIRNQLEGKTVKKKNHHIHMEAKQYVLNNQWVTKEIKEEI